MKNKLFRTGLMLLARISKWLQIGNPARMAPGLTSAPEMYQQVHKPFGEDDYFSVWHLQEVICSGTYGGAVINKSNHVYQRFISFPWGTELHPVFSLPYLGKRTGAVEKAVFLITPEAKGNYYHWIIDLLPRLLLVRQCRPEDFQERIIILHHPSKRYEQETLRILGINDSQVLRLRSFETVAVKDLVISDFTRQGRLFAHWKKELLREFRQLVHATGDRETFHRIYLLRGKQRKRRLIGEELLIQKLSAIGFQAINMQELSLAEQVNLLSEARVVVAPHGAALSNIVFCREGTLVVELRSIIKPPEYYSEIAKAYNLQFECVYLAPHRISGKDHRANKQNLILTEQSIFEVLSKLQPEFGAHKESL